ncbi:MAG: hypothetical protein PHV18_08415 [Lachnospiraceae bacterium]|nr:hypothetical protein [Lachnospiraceae bacterium]
MQKNKKISYIRKPFAKKSRGALVLAVVALVCCVCSLMISVHMQGQGGINMAAWGFSSIVFSVLALWYGGLSFLEKEMNYILAKAAIAVSGVLLIFWISMIIVGLVS